MLTILRTPLTQDQVIMFRDIPQNSLPDYMTARFLPVRSINYYTILEGPLLKQMKKYYHQYF